MSLPAGGVTVEFVCTGNICRSPFAAGVAVALGLPREQVYSSGLWADPGRACPGPALTAAAEYGVDLRPHGARRADSAELGERDWVLAMEFGQLGKVQRLVPPAWSGTATLLGRFAPGAGVEIPDPYGGELEEYRTVYRLIRQSVATWLAALPGESA